MLVREVRDNRPRIDGVMGVVRPNHEFGGLDRGMKGRAYKRVPMRVTRPPPRPRFNRGSGRSDSPSVT